MSSSTKPSSVLITKNDLFVALCGFLLFLATVPIFTYLYFAKDLQTKEGIMNRNDTGVVLLDKDNKPFYTFYHAKTKTHIPLDAIPLLTQRAFIAAEDEDFYTHIGFSLKAIVAALVADIRSGNAAYGGSTITQQLVKNSLLTPNKSFLRKTQEIILAQEIEQRYSKKEILEMYLNSVYFGEGAFGIEQAAQTYFGKKTNELNLAESSLLAGLLPSPSNLSPLTKDPGRAKVRQTYVLRKMYEQQYISADQKQQATTEELTFNKNRDLLNENGTLFALYIRKKLIETYGEEEISRSGFKVYTTIDMTWQRYAEEIVRSHVEKLKPNRATNGSAVVIDPKTGEVKVFVGSKDWYDDSVGKIDLATTPRQPGSSFKPIVYAGAMEKGVITPATILKDEPTTFPINYKPNNYDKKFRGQVTVRRALANSLNVPSVEILNRLTVPEALETAKKLGITTLKEPSDYGLSLVLGTGEVSLLELTHAYSAFASYGQQHDLVLIRAIDDKMGNRIFTHHPQTEQVLSPEVAFLISSILSDNNARREVFGNVLTISRPAAVKTGTSENYRDALTLGYTPSLTIGVWVGNNDNAPMDNIAGSLGAAPIWKSLMEEFLKGTPVEQFRIPDNIVAKTVCLGGATTKDATQSGKLEYFVKGTEPDRPCISPSVTLSPSSPSNISPTPTTLQSQNTKQNPSGQSNSSSKTTPTYNLNNLPQEKDKKEKDN